MHFWKNEIQPDLFKNVDSSKKQGLRNFIFSKKMELTIQYDSIVVLVISFLMINIVVYTLGVERGKRMSGIPDYIADLKHIVENKKDKKNINCNPTTEQKEDAINIKTTQPVEKKKIKTMPADSITVKQSDTCYSIQVATYLSDNYARTEELNWRKNGHKTFIIKKGKYYVLCIGDFISKNVASNELKNFKKRFKDCFIRTIAKEDEV
ncbi:MAG: SPOR domain-containing protein [Candidatus Omnitrophota bacterium]